MMMPGMNVGPSITPKHGPGGGAALPPYLQMRRPTGLQGGGMKPSYPGQQTQPVVTPKSSVIPGEASSKGPGGTPWGPGGPQPMPKVTPAQGTMTPNPVAPKPPQAGGNSLMDLYNFQKSDLQNETNQKLASTRSDAAARGVFYGTPLTGSEADINTQYLRGLGQLDAGMYGNEQQNQNQRLGLASQLVMSNPNVPIPGGLDFSGLASLFGQSPAVAGQRSGPVAPITPKNKINDPNADRG